MNQPLVLKDTMLLKREAFVRGLYFVIIALTVASVLTGLQRELVFDKEREAALERDRAVWMNQGERNPHSAAHFARYAFRPPSPIAVVDPGTTDFSGLAVWMEAHFQDPAVFRRAEDSGELGRYTQLTPAFLLLTVAPLIVFLMLFGSIAGERQDGTLRQLLASGVSGSQFFRGKLFSGLRMTLVGYSLIFIPVAVASVWISPSGFDADAVLRLLALYLAYAAYLSIFVAIAIAVSAMFRTRDGAFLALTCIWVLVTIMVPRFSADFATALYAQPDARETTELLRTASYTYYENDERREEIRQEILDEHGVENVEDLPINFSAYELQVSEDLSEPEFDRIYAEMDQRYASQEAVMRGFSIASPALPMAKLSSGLAGTDREHQREFTAAAESHRREMIQLLNEDYMYNAANTDASYTSDEELWAEFKDLPYEAPRLTQIWGAYLVDALLLILWVIIATLLARGIVNRAVRGEVPTS